VLIFINAYLLSSSWKKIWICISVLAFMLGVEYLTVRFKVIEYVKWNFIYAAIVEVAYLLIGLGLAKAVLFLQEWERRKHDSSL
jgi:membrane protein YdbS with pleckstrin-like domain